MNKLPVLIFAIFILAAYWAAPKVYAYSTQEILNYCYPNAQYGARYCDASGVQAGASCTEDVGGSVRYANECGCFGQNTNHTYTIEHHPTQCNDGQGNISQFETFSCVADQGIQFGQCGNPSTCNYVQDCEAPPGDGPHSGTQVLTGLIQPNGLCGPDSRVPPNPSVCKPKETAQVIPVDANPQYDPRILSQEEPVNIYVSAWRACSTNGTLDKGQGVVGDQPNGDCTVVQPMTCDKPNPIDERKCWMELSCKAADKVGSYIAKYTTNNPNCTSIDNYYINPAADCANKPRTQATSSSRDVTVENAVDDKQIAQLQSNTLPTPLKDQLTTDSYNSDKLAFQGTTTSDSRTETGIQGGFFGQLQSLVCKIPVVTAFLRFTYCPERVDIAQESTFTDHSLTMALANSQRPTGYAAQNDKADCVLQDVPEQNGSSTITEGNQKINDINSADQTLYSKDSPDLGNILKHNPNSKIIFGGQQLDDERQDGNDSRCEVYLQQGNFPSGITVCNNNNQ